jgi:hypothetical protein
MRIVSVRNLLLYAGIALTQACVTSEIDQRVASEPAAGIGDASVVILGRRHGSDYETEPDFVSCVGRYVASRDKSVTVIGELEFLNALYPWFEPRTAPMHPQDIERLLAQQPVQEKLAALKVEYMVWLDGSTVRSGGSGSMACSVGGCFGFGTWTHDSNYEATIWDFTDRTEVGQVNTRATGQSYMPAVIIPIPIIAPVQGTACDGIGEQLLAFLSSKY